MPSAGALMHTPAAHTSLVQPLPSSQLAHAAPPEPHAVASLPTTQAAPFQQPAQHAPPQHCPATPPVEHGVASVTGLGTQTPAVHASSVEQGSLSAANTVWSTGSANQGGGVYLANGNVTLSSMTSDW